MPFWTESWVTWLFVYFLPVWFAVPHEQAGQRALDLLGVLLVWLLGQIALVRHGRFIASSGRALAAAGSQLVFCAATLSWSLGWIGSEYLAASVPFVLAAAIAVSSLERKNHEPMPRYGLEALLMTCSVCVYLPAHFRLANSGLSTGMSLLALHAGILGVALARNSRLVVQYVQPVIEGRYVWEAWRMRFREPRGIRALIAAATLPSGALGVCLIFVESVLVTVLRDRVQSLL